jgi:hypothetical protein
MRIRLFHFSHLAALTLLLSGCRDGAPNSEATAPDPADLPASSLAVGGSEIVRFKLQGNTASASIHLEQPQMVMGSVEVTQNCCSEIAGQTILFYSLSSCDPVTGDCVIFQEGVGTIPARDFFVRGSVTTLRTNTAANPSFSRLTGPGGPIVLQWKRTSERVSELQQRSRTRTKGVEMSRNRFVLTSSSAIASGTIFGLTIKPGNSDASVGAIRSGEFAISKLP